MLPEVFGKLREGLLWSWHSARAMLAKAYGVAKESAAGLWLCSKILALCFFGLVFNVLWELRVILFWLWRTLLGKVRSAYAEAKANATWLWSISKLLELRLISYAQAVFWKLWAGLRRVGPPLVSFAQAVFWKLWAGLRWVWPPLSAILASAYRMVRAVAVGLLLWSSTLLTLYFDSYAHSVEVSVSTAVQNFVAQPLVERWPTTFLSISEMYAELYLDYFHPVADMIGYTVGQCTGREHLGVWIAHIVFLGLCLMALPHQTYFLIVHGLALSSLAFLMEQGVPYECSFLGMATVVTLMVLLWAACWRPIYRKLVRMFSFPLRWRRRPTSALRRTSSRRMVLPANICVFSFREYLKCNKPRWSWELARHQCAWSFSESLKCKPSRWEETRLVCHSFFGLGKECQLVPLKDMFRCPWSPSLRSHMVRVGNWCPKYGRSFLCRLGVYGRNFVGAYPEMSRAIDRKAFEAIKVIKATSWFVYGLVTLRWIPWLIRFVSTTTNTMVEGTVATSESILSVILWRPCVFCFTVTWRICEFLFIPVWWLLVLAWQLYSLVFLLLEKLCGLLLELFVLAGLVFELAWWMLKFHWKVVATFFLAVLGFLLAVLRLLHLFFIWPWIKLFHFLRLDWVIQKLGSIFVEQILIPNWQEFVATVEPVWRFCLPLFMPFWRIWLMFSTLVWLIWMMISTLVWVIWMMFSTLVWVICVLLWQHYLTLWRFYLLVSWVVHYLRALLVDGVASTLVRLFTAFKYLFWLCVWPFLETAGDDQLPYKLVYDDQMPWDTLMPDVQCSATFADNVREDTCPLDICYDERKLGPHCSWSFRTFVDERSCSDDCYECLLEPRCAWSFPVYATQQMSAEDVEDVSTTAHWEYQDFYQYMTFIARFTFMRLLVETTLFGFSLIPIAASDSFLV